jgi:uncharacterized protein (TIGR02444 family)
MHTGGDFWGFSLHVYQQPGVAHACMELQDRLSADVNLILFALWTGANGRRLDRMEIRSAADAVTEWQRDIVQALRGLRRRLKVGPAPAPNLQTEEVRQAIKASELAAEKIEQDTLQELLRTQLAERPQEDATAVAAANVVSMLRISASLPPQEPEVGLISTIVKAAVPTADGLTVQTAVSRAVHTSSPQ